MLLVVGENYSSNFERSVSSGSLIFCIDYTLPFRVQIATDAVNQTYFLLTDVQFHCQPRNSIVFSCSILNELLLLFGKIS